MQLPNFVFSSYSICFPKIVEVFPDEIQMILMADHDVHCAVYYDQHFNLLII